MLRTIARCEIDGALGCIEGEPTKNKITAPLAVAPTAHATNTAKMGRLERPPRAWPHSE